MKIEIDSQNSAYLNQDGVLFSKDKTILYHVPDKFTTYDVPESVKIIKSEAFKNCAKLTRVTIPSSVITIEDDTFICCKRLTTVQLSEGLKHLGTPAIKSDEISPFMDDEQRSLAGVFTGCWQLDELHIPASVTYVCCNLFGRSSILDAMHPDDYDAYIRMLRFNPDAELPQLTIKTKVIVNPNNQNYASKDGVLFDKAMTTLFYCPNIFTNYTMPESVKTIEAFAFFYCDQLNTITTSKQLNGIAFSAFINCKNLKEITLPATFNGFITDSPLAKVSHFFDASITRIHIDPENQRFASQDGIMYTKDLTALLYLPDVFTEITLPDTVKGVEEFPSSFAHTTKLERVYVADDFIVPEQMDLPEDTLITMHCPARIKFIRKSKIDTLTMPEPGFLSPQEACLGWRWGQPIPSYYTLQENEEGLTWLHIFTPNRNYRNATENAIVYVGGSEKLIFSIRIILNATNIALQQDNTPQEEIEDLKSILGKAFGVDFPMFSIDDEFQAFTHPGEGMVGLSVKLFLGNENAVIIDITHLPTIKKILDEAKARENQFELMRF